MKPADRMVAFKDYINKKGTYDDNGHGTMWRAVCGNSYGSRKYSGIAPDNIIAIKTLDKEGSGDTSDVICDQWVLITEIGTT